MKRSGSESPGGGKEAKTAKETEPVGAESVGAEPVGSKPGGAVRVGAEPAGAKPAGVDLVGAEPIGADQVGVEPVGVVPAGVVPAGAEPARPEPAGVEPVGAQPIGADLVGMEPVGVVPAGVVPAGAQPVGALIAGDSDDDISIVWIGKPKEPTPRKPRKPEPVEEPNTEVGKRVAALLKVPWGKRPLLPQVKTNYEAADCSNILWRHYPRRTTSRSLPEQTFCEKIDHIVRSSFHRREEERKIDPSLSDSPDYLQMYHEIRELEKLAKNGAEGVELIKAHEKVKQVASDPSLEEEPPIANQEGSSNG